VAYTIEDARLAVHKSGFRAITFALLPSAWIECMDRLILQLDPVPLGTQLLLLLGIGCVVAFLVDLVVFLILQLRGPGDEDDGFDEGPPSPDGPSGLRQRKVLTSRTRPITQRRPIRAPPYKRRSAPMR
jgi:hypothetical protein